MKEQLQREHRYLKRRLEQLSVSGSLERVRTDSMGSTISTDSEQGSARSTQFAMRNTERESRSHLKHFHSLTYCTAPCGKSAALCCVTMICKSNVDHLHINGSTLARAEVDVPAGQRKPSRSCLSVCPQSCCGPREKACPWLQGDALRSKVNTLDFR